MKTPKEILLTRHQAMESQLNAVRRRALAELDRPGSSPGWREWIFSLRWHLAGMGAVWLAVLLLHVDASGGSTVVMAREKVPSARAFVVALARNRQELRELTEWPQAAAPGALPPRRSEVQLAREVV